MFVRSLMSKDVTYRKGGESWVIKAGTTILIDEGKVSAKELKSLYGDRIVISSRTLSYEPEVVVPVQKKVERKSEFKEPVTLDEDLIDDIISQIEKEKEQEEKAKEEAELEAKKLEEERIKKEQEEKAKKEAELEAELEAKKFREEKAKKEAEKTKATVKVKTSSGRRRGRAKAKKA